MMLRAAFVSLLMAFVAIGTGLVARPDAQQNVAPNLDALLPDNFADWTQVRLTSAVLPAEAALGPGEAVAYRAYRDNTGRMVTLVAAYGPPLGDSVRLHRPESCYVAQGFAIRDRYVSTLQLGEDVAAVIRLDTENSMRKEAVSYWLRDGGAYITGAPGHQLLSFKRGLLSPSESVLVRISSSGAGPSSFEFHDRFMSAFVNALSPEARALLIARPS